MKNYMVSCDLGGSYIGVYYVDTPDDYAPSKDGEHLLKEKILKKYLPKKHYFKSDTPFSTYVSVCAGDYITERELKIIAISRTDL